MLLLAGDIGGTNTRLCLAETKNDNNDFVTLRETTYPSLSGDFVSIVKTFLNEEFKPDAACFAVAGPVVENKCKITNLPWEELNGENLQIDLDIPKITLINDFVAVGYDIVLNQNKDLLTLQSGKVSKTSPIAIIGAGTGLGKAFAIPQGNSYEVYPSEGGHTNFAPDNQIKDELLKTLRINGSVDTEAVLSGPGILTIFHFLRDSLFPNESVDIFLNQEDAAKTIAIEASQENPNPLCKKTMDLFMEAYGSAAGDMAVTFLPYGGLFIAGGIASQNLPLIQDGKFITSFKTKARVNPVLLEKVPIHIVLNTLTGLMGAVRYAVNKM